MNKHEQSGTNKAPQYGEAGEQGDISRPLPPSYCTTCGHIQDECDTRTYSASTGKLVTAMVCSNTKCIEHCHFHYKHVFGAFWKL